MATYFVRPDGNNNNAGTGPLASQAWATLSKAASVVTAGDTLIIAPGTYSDGFINTVTQSDYVAGQKQTVIKGDPRCNYFTGMTPGDVIIKDGALKGSNYCLISFAGIKSIVIMDIKFQRPLTPSTNGFAILVSNCTLTIIRCYFDSLIRTSTIAYSISLNSASAILYGCIFNNCYNSLGGFNSSILMKKCIVRADTSISTDTIKILLGTSIFPCIILDNCIIIGPGTQPIFYGYGVIVESTIIGTNTGDCVYSVTNSPISIDNSILINSSTGNTLKTTASGATSYLKNVIMSKAPNLSSGGTVNGIYSSSLVIPQDFSKIGPELSYRETDPALQIVEGSKGCLRVVVAYTGRAKLCTFKAEAGKTYKFNAKLKRSFISGRAVVRVGGQLAGAKSQLDSTLSVIDFELSFFAPRSGVYPVELWACDADGTSEQYILVDDISVTEVEN